MLYYDVLHNLPASGPVIGMLGGNYLLRASEVILKGYVTVWYERARNPLI